MTVSLAALGLDSLVERNQERRAVQKRELVTRLDQKTAEDKAEADAEKQWKAAVWKRDKGCCRVCGCKVNRSLELTPKRGEAHHVAPREDKAVKWDRRNGLLLCAIHHQAITRHELSLSATARQLFRVGTKTYLNADEPLMVHEHKR